MPASKVQTATGFTINNFKGIGWILLSVLASSAMTVAVRGASLSIDSRMIVLLRASITLLALIAGILLIARLRRRVQFSRPWLHLSRGLMVALSVHFGFYTIAKIPLATATVLFFLAPIFATMLSVLVHKEKVGSRRIFAIFLGFSGAVVIIRPGFEEIDPAMFSALVSSLFFAGALTQSREIAEADGSFSALLSSVAVTVAISIPLAIPVFELPTGSVLWGYLLLLVATGAIRNLADIEAYRHGEASILTPFTYLRVVLVGVAAYFLFSEIPDQYTLFGAAIIIAATLYIANRERLQKYQPTKAPELD